MFPSCSNNCDNYSKTEDGSLPLLRSGSRRFVVFPGLNCYIIKISIVNISENEDTRSMVSHRQNRFAFAVILCLFIVAIFTATGNTQVKQTILSEVPQPGPDTYHPNRVIVRFSDVVSREAAVTSMQRLGCSVSAIAGFRPTVSFPQGVRLGIVELPKGMSADSAISMLSSDPGILYVERDYLRYPDQARIKTQVFPNDVYFDRLWGLHNENS